MENGNTTTKFHYHAQGTDNNGNGGPWCTDAGWIEIDATSDDDAVSKLPPTEQEKVMSFLTWAREDEGDMEMSLTDAINREAGMGMGFSLMDELNWECFCEQ